MRRWWVGVLLAALMGSGSQARAVAGASQRAPTAILVEAESGQVLREQGADSPRPQGSLNQLMLLLLSLEQSALGVLPLDVPVTVSHAAVGAGLAGGARVPLRPDRPYLLSDLLKAVTMAGANDAAVGVAEAIAGSVEAALDLMNARARRLGMTGTHYTSIGGIKAATIPEAETTTARDLAGLAQALLRQQVVLEWASLSGVPFDQGAVLLRNTNQLLGAFAGADGLQVSSARVAARGGSYSIVATARRDNLRLVAIVLDASDAGTRYSSAAELLEWGFAHYRRIDVVRKGDAVNLPVHVLNGTIAQLTPVAGKALTLLRRCDDEPDLQLRYQLPATLAAPLKRLQPIGEIVVEERGELIGIVPLLSPAAVASDSILSAALP
ncbi:MAG: serine hydrolase [Candidatus Binatia bacterium]|jgi:serine-type D-Ala-D-Ala carboxypeptidase (penicillin-binding protein 5/6)